MFRVRRSGPSEHSNVRLEGCVAELDPASFGGEAPLPSGAFGCSTSKPPFPLVGDRKQIPPSVVSWSPTAACPSTRFLLPCSPPHPPSPTEKSSIAERNERENGRRRSSSGAAAVLWWKNAAGINALGSAIAAGVFWAWRWPLLSWPVVLVEALRSVI